MNYLIPILCVSLASCYDLFNARKVPVWVFTLFLILAIISIYPCATMDEGQKNIILLGLMASILPLTINSDNTIGRADIAAWGATAIAVPDIDYLVISFLYSCTFTSIWFGLQVARGRKIKEITREGVPYLPFMLFGLLVSMLHVGGMG